MATEAAWLNGEKETIAEREKLLTWIGLLMEGVELSDAGNQNQSNFRYQVGIQFRF